MREGRGSHRTKNSHTGLCPAVDYAAMGNYDEHMLVAQLEAAKQNVNARRYDPQAVKQKQRRGN